MSGKADISIYLKHMDVVEMRDEDRVLPGISGKPELLGITRYFGYFLT